MTSTSPDTLRVAQALFALTCDPAFAGLVCAVLAGELTLQARKAGE